MSKNVSSVSPAFEVARFFVADSVRARAMAAFFAAGRGPVISTACRKKNRPKFTKGGLKYVGIKS